MLDFGSVFLSQHELEILRFADTGKVIDVTHVSVSALLSYGFLAPYPLDESCYVITPLGCDYCEYLDKKALEKKRRERKESFRFWLPVILSNAMALAALIISIIALRKAQ